MLFVSIVVSMEINRRHYFRSGPHTSNGVSRPMCTYDNGPSLTKLRIPSFGVSLFPTVKLNNKENVRMTTVLLLYVSRN